MFLLLRNFFFNLYFLFITVFFSLAFLPLLASREKALIAIRIWIKAIFAGLKYIMGITYQIIGEKHLNPKQECIYAACHQSMWETLVFFLHLPEPIFILKKELTEIPVLGWYIKRLAMISINRKDGASAIRKMLQQLTTLPQKRKQLIIFPEGTRAKPSNEFKPKPGITILYRELKLPVVPVWLNSGLYWPKNSFAKKPGVITMKLFSPITPGLSDSEFKTKLIDTLSINTDIL